MGHCNDMFTIVLIILKLSPSQSSFTYIEKSGQHILQTYTLCVLQKKEGHASLIQHKIEWIMTKCSYLGELQV